MSKVIAAFLIFTLMGLLRPAWAVLNVLACEPEWAALVREIGADKVSASSATTAMQDPHRIEARPSLLARARTADLLVCSGADLEVGWLPLLMQQSGNRRIQSGGPGFLEASRLVPRLEIPVVLDRAQGDVHPAGNPHVHLDPRNVSRIAEALVERLAQLDPANAAWYRERGAAFLGRWRSAIERWEKQAAPLRGASIVVYHKDLSYLIAWLQLNEVGTLEPKPGIPPTPGHLAELVAKMQQQPAKMIVHSAYQDPQPAQFLSQRTRIPVVVLPYTVGGTPQAPDLFGLFDDTLARLTGVLR